jgi:hypothetical protein
MRRLLSILIVPLAVVGCVNAGSGGSPSAPASPTPNATAAPRYIVDAGADKLILRIASDGGFVAPGFLLTRLPTFALYGDGRIMVQGPMIEIYPGPLLPNLRQMQVTPSEIQQILAAADAAGLLGPDASYDATGIFDVATTVFTTIVGGKTHHISAYALMEGTTAESAAAAAARTKLIDFSGKIMDLSKFLGRDVSDATAYSPKSMRVFVGPEPAVDAALPNPQVVTWPLAVDPQSGVTTNRADLKCLVVSGQDLVAFLKVATGANALTVWSAPSGKFSVSVRPLYPEETGCPAAAV